MLVTEFSHLNLEITGWCNQKCSYCFNDSTSRGNSSVGERWAKMLPTLASSAGLRSVHITGGEPFGYKGILELIDLIDGLGVEVTVLSNGFRIAALCKSRPATLSKIRKAQISLDSLDPSVVSTRRGSPVAFTDATSALRELKNLNVDVEVSAVVGRDTEDSIGELERFCEENNYGLLLRELEENLRAGVKNASTVELRDHTHDEFFYLPSNRRLGVSKGIRTADSAGELSPVGIVVDGKLISNIEDMEKVAA